MAQGRREMERGKGRGVGDMPCWRKGWLGAVKGNCETLSSFAVASGSCLRR
jgi:hypothetical protein